MAPLSSRMTAIAIRAPDSILHVACRSATTCEPFCPNTLSASTASASISGIHDFSVLKTNDPVRAPGDRVTVRDDYGGAPAFPVFIEESKNALLGLAVDFTRRLVGEENGRT